MRDYQLLQPGKSMKLSTATLSTVSYDVLTFFADNTYALVITKLHFMYPLIYTGRVMESVYVNEEGNALLLNERDGQWHIDVGEGIQRACLRMGERADVFMITHFPHGEAMTLTFILQGRAK